MLRKAFLNTYEKHTPTLPQRSQLQTLQLSLPMSKFSVPPAADLKVDLLKELDS